MGNQRCLGPPAGCAGTEFLEPISTEMLPSVHEVARIGCDTGSFGRAAHKRRMNTNTAVVRTFAKPASLSVLICLMNDTFRTSAAMICSILSSDALRRADVYDSCVSASFENRGLLENSRQMRDSLKWETKNGGLRLSGKDTFAAGLIIGKTVRNARIAANVASNAKIETTIQDIQPLATIATT